MQGATDSSGHLIDRDFYRTFWGLQAVFQQPYSIIEPSAWAAATASINRVLAEFRKQVRTAHPSPFMCLTTASQVEIARICKRCGVLGPSWADTSSCLTAGTVW